ncbi:MAG: biotin/lipoyl-binding protein, partial [Gemmataceae bacterium]|nr:biotin/lipoyl-binding protein [Gemmataceae bacterium]
PGRRCPENWLRNARPVRYVAGGLLVVGSLLGARLWAHGSGGEAGGRPAAPPTNGAGGSGPVVLGYVDSDPPPVSTGLPPVLQSGEVAEVYVKAGAEVKAGDRLYKFDTRFLEAEVKGAEEAVKVARANVVRAKAAEDQFPQLVAAQELKLKAADEKVRTTAEAVQVFEFNLRRTLANTQSKDDIQRLFENDPKRFELRVPMLTAPIERDAERIAFDRLKATDATADRKAAEAQVEQAKAALAKAKTAVELCTVRARVAGAVERVNVGPGDVIGVGTRTPAAVLVPAGPRVVRAEVEAEFAHRVGPEKIGKEVVIYDHSDAKLAYKGVVRRVGTTFLPKRSDGGLVPNETRVLEALVEVADPAPPGKPPLRVGQRVKVNFGP